MPAKKTPQRAAKTPAGGLSLSDKEREALRKGAEADMKRHGFKTVAELEAYYDKKRGY